MEIVIVLASIVLLATLIYPKETKYGRLCTKFVIALACSFVFVFSSCSNSRSGLPLPCEGATIEGTFDTNVGAYEVLYRVGETYYISTYENDSYGTQEELTQIDERSFAVKGSDKVAYKLNYGYSLLVYGENGEKIDEWKKID